MSDKHFAGKFDARNFGGVMRELIFFRTNQLGDKETAKDLWQAQREVVVLRAKLERVYNGQFQRAKAKSGSTEFQIELWMLGLAAYVLITEEGRRLDDVRNMSGPKLVKKAVELAEPIIEESSSMLEVWVEKERPEDEAYIWQMPYFFEKKSIPEEKE